MGGSSLSLLQLSHELIVDSSCDESHGQLSLGLELVDSLLQSLVDVLHLKVLLLHSSKIRSQTANALVIGGDEALVVVELGTVFLHDLVEAVLHHVDLQSQLVHLLVQFQILGSLVVQDTLLLSQFVSELLAILSQLGSLSFQLIRSLL